LAEVDVGPAGGTLSGQRLEQAGDLTRPHDAVLAHRPRDGDQLVELLLPGEQVALLAQERLQQGELVLASELLALEVRLGGAGEVLQERGDAQHQQREDDDQQPPVPGLTYAPEVLRKEVDVYHRGPLLPPVATPAGTGSRWISPSVNAGHPPQRQAQRDRELRRHLLEV